MHPRRSFIVIQSMVYFDNFHPWTIVELFYVLVFPFIETKSKIVAFLVSINLPQTSLDVTINPLIYVSL